VNEAASTRIDVRPARMTDWLGQLIPLHAAHYREAEPYRPGDWRPDYPAYLLLDQQELLPMVGAFTVDGIGDPIIVGYLLCVLSRDLHHQDRQAAHEAGVYVHPSFRRYDLLSRLYDGMEQELKRRGVDSVVMTSRHVAPNGRNLGTVLKRKGYRPLYEGWVKQLGDG
jgi:ribosomal protein S18 acetylase RimI-like enzyme